MNTITLSVNDRALEATLAANSSAQALIELLREGPVTIDAHDYGNQEKVGSLPVSLPSNDELTDVLPGDLILYQGNQFVAYYASNSWPLTRLGRLEGISETELRGLLGPDGARIVLSLG